MKELYLHIGTHKTGTTALQNFFAINQAPLKRKGIDYPDVDNLQKEVHRRLVLTFYPNNMTPYCQTIPNVKDSLEEWRMVLDLAEEKKILISTEQFFTCPPEIISKIREITASHHVKIICYIRRQDELEESWYNQSIKGFRSSNSLPMAMGEYDTQKHFSDWENIFGPESILVRPYEKKHFYKGSLFSDFLHHVFDIELSDEFTLPPKEENTRLHRIALEYQRLINCLSMTDEQKNKFNRPMRDVSEELFKEGYKSCPVFSPDSRAQLLKTNESFYHYLAQEYLSRKDGAFFSDLSIRSQDNGCFYELTKDDACCIHAYLAKNYDYIFDRLLKGIESSLNSKDAISRDAAILLLGGIFKMLISVMEKCSMIEGSKAWKIHCNLRKMKRCFHES